MALTSDAISTRARNVAVFQNSGEYDVEKNIIFKHFTFVAKDLTSEGGVHKLWIKLYGPGDSRSSEQCVVSCDCENYLFHHEVANTSYDSSVIEHSNGAYPSETNPNMMPGLCKHLYAAAMRINQYSLRDVKDYSIRSFTAFLTLSESKPQPRTANSQPSVSALQVQVRCSITASNFFVLTAFLARL